MEIFLIEKISAAAILILFWTNRYIWTFIKGKRTKSKTSVGITSGRFWNSCLVYLTFPLLLIFNIFSLQEVSTITSSRAIYWFGLLFGIQGLIFMFLARFHRQNDWGFMGDEAADKLFTGGIYSWSRHPYYVGAVLVGIGLYFILNSWFVLVMIPVILFVRNVIKKEEIFLQEHFGQEWLDYKNRVGIFYF